MKLWKSLLIALVLFMGAKAFAGGKAKLETVHFTKSDNEGRIVLNLDRPATETPELTVNSAMIQLVLPKTYVWPKIEKKVSTTKDFDTTIMAYQYDKNLVRFRVMVPYELKGKENQISLNMDNNQITLNFPIIKGKNKVTAAAKQVSNASDLDEGYLKDLLSKKDGVKLKDDFFNSKKTKDVPSFRGTKTDTVSRKLSALDKKKAMAPEKKAGGFSIASYVGKFVAFLGLILVFFYGVMHLMKKGVLKKGKLGFLNDTNIVEVLNTTYLGPKKSLLLVKVHKQVFLLSSTDKGLEFLSELNDTTGLLKSGEEKIAGHNFDGSLTNATKEDKSFKLKDVASSLDKYKKSTTEKEDISAANAEANSSNKGTLDDFLAKTEEEVTDSVKLSDQIKNKMKNLKQFQ